jgi:hypothetical protein
MFAILASFLVQKILAWSAVIFSSRQKISACPCQTLILNVEKQPRTAGVNEQQFIPSFKAYFTEWRQTG